MGLTSGVVTWRALFALPEAALDLRAARADDTAPDLVALAGVVEDLET